MWNWLILVISESGEVGVKKAAKEERLTIKKKG